jgi:two-component system cell cycle response regulator
MTTTRVTVGIQSLPDRPRAACLVEICGPNLGRTYVLDDAETSIGRATECGITLDLDSVSRRHCTVLAGQPAFALRDEGSTNGTFVNEQRVDRQTELHTGDLILSLAKTRSQRVETREVPDRRCRSWL